jgi:Rad3-related DNA helicase
VEIAVDILGSDEYQLLIQAPSMDEEEREDFLKHFFEERDNTLIGFCVLGSLFSEGIDLTGDKLIGVLVVGTGLPKICKEREIIRSFFDNKGKKGYDYAYRYPGMNRVLQAAGRVIRTREDQGFILLMDDRFLLYENQTLLPQDWDSYYEVSLSNCSEVIRTFFEG